MCLVDDNNIRVGECNSPLQINDCECHSPLPVNEGFVEDIVGELFADGGDELGFDGLNILRRREIGKTGEGLCEIGFGVQLILVKYINRNSQAVLCRNIGIDGGNGDAVFRNFTLHRIIGIIVVQLRQRGLR